MNISKPLLPDYGYKGDPLDLHLIPEKEAREYLLYKARQGAVRDESEAHTIKYLRFIRDHDCATPEKFSDQWLAEITFDALNQRTAECGGKIVTFADALELAEMEMAFQFVLSPLPGEKKNQGLMAIGSVHCIQGSSAAGKTTLGVQILTSQEKGENVFQRETFKRPYLVLMRDRSGEEMERTLYGLGELGKNLNYRQVPLEREHDNPAVVIEEMVRAENPRYPAPRKPKIELVLVEGLDLWCEEAKEMKHVDTLMSAVRDVATRLRVSIIGTIGAPKMKPKERYAQARDRGYGSSAWARKFDTVLDIAVDEEEVRHIELLGRNSRPQKFRMVFNEDGLLVPRESSITVGEALPTWQEIAKVHDCGRARAFEILADMKRAK